MSFAHMKAMVTANGATTRGAKIHDGQKLMENQFDTDPSYRDSYYVWEFGKDSEELVFMPLKYFDEKYSEALGFTAHFNCLISDHPVIGDILYDSKKNFYWLVVEGYDRDEILYAGKMRKLNAWLKWQDKEGNIYEYPAYDHNTTQYNSGVSGGIEIQLGSTQHVLQTTADVNTIAIDHDMRFFLDRNTKNPTAFVVTQNDTTDMNYDKGITKITLSEDEYRPEKDRIDLWLCDYIEPKAKYDIDIAYEGEPNISVGMSKWFTASDEAAIFTADLDDKLTKYIDIVNEGDGKCEVSVKLYQRIIGEKFILKAAADNKVGEVEITITGGV